MSELYVECATCKQMWVDRDIRNVPTWDPQKGMYADGYYCPNDFVAAVRAAHAHVAALDIDAVDDDEMSMLFLVAFLRARGLSLEDVPGDAAEGMEGIRQKLLALLDRLQGEARLPVFEGGALCSACFRAVPVSQVRVLPWSSEPGEGFVTTFRCGECFPAAIAETRVMLENANEAGIASFAECLERHSIVVGEYRQGKPVEEVRSILLQVLEMLSARTLTLSVGESVPVSPPQGPAGGQEAAAGRAPGSPPPAPPAPATPRRSWWSRLFGG